MAFIEDNLNIDLQGIQDFYSYLQVGPVSITLMGTPRGKPQPPFNSECAIVSRDGEWIIHRYDVRTYRGSRPLDPPLFGR